MDRLKRESPFISSFVVQQTAYLDERITNTDNLGEVSLKASRTDPQLQRQLINRYLSPHSLIIHHPNVNQCLAAEYFQMDSDRNIRRVKAHYFHHTQTLSSNSVSFRGSTRRESQTLLRLTINRGTTLFSDSIAETKGENGKNRSRASKENDERRQPRAGLEVIEGKVRLDHLLTIRVCFSQLLRY